MYKVSGQIHGAFIKSGVGVIQGDHETLDGRLVESIQLSMGASGMSRPPPHDSFGPSANYLDIAIGSFKRSRFKNAPHRVGLTYRQKVRSKSNDNIPSVLIPSPSGYTTTLGPSHKTRQKV